MDELDLILWLFLVIGSAGVIAAFLFYGGAFLIQRVKLLFLEVEARRVEVISQRASVKMALDQNDLQTQVISLDANGLPPVSRKMIDSGLTTQAAFQIAQAFIDAQRTHAPTPRYLIDGKWRTDAKADQCVLHRCHTDTCLVIGNLTNACPLWANYTGRDRGKEQLQLTSASA